MDLIKEHIIDISNNYYKYLMSLENVNGVGLGTKWINGLNTFEPCINVLVKNKIDNNYISKNNLIPKSYMGIKTDVLNIGNIESQVLNCDKIRPLKGGCAIGIMKKDGTGTLGCIVSKVINDKKEFFILTNNHVLSSPNQTPIGSIIVQPSHDCAGIHPTNIVASLITFIPIEMINETDEPVNYVDCAIAKVFSPTLITNEILDIGKVTGSAKATLNMNVRKSGFMTGLTNGKVVITNLTIKVNYDEGKTLRALFKDQLLIKIETKYGDSGSVVVNDDNKIVGLHMSGNGNGFALSNNIDNVLRTLDIEIYTE